MRKPLAIVAILCGAASAYAAEPAKWCSDGFDAPAVLTISDDAAFTLTIGNKAETFEYGGSIGTGISGFAIAGAKGPEAFFQAEMVNLVVPNSPETIPLRLFRDRVFFPCD